MALVPFLALLPNGITQLHSVPIAKMNLPDHDAPLLRVRMLTPGLGTVDFISTAGSLWLQQMVLRENQMQQLDFFATGASGKMKCGSEGQRIPGTGS